MTRRINSTCPFCGTVNDRATAVTKKGERGEEPRPTPGSAALCFRCGKWSIFTSKLRLRPATVAELMQLSSEHLPSTVERDWNTVIGKKKLQ